MSLGKQFVSLVLSALAALPLRVHYVLSDVLAFLAYRVVCYRRSVVIQNLRGSFPEKTDKEIKSLCSGFYHHFGEIISEAVWFGGCRNPERLRRSHIVSILNPEVITKAFESGKSVVIMYSHCGNWELLGGIEHYNYTNSTSPFTTDNYCVVYKKMSSRVWDEILRENRFAPLEDRENFGGYIETNNLIRYVISHSGEKKIYNINTDQRPYRSSIHAVSVRFLNRDCSSMAAAAEIASKYGFSVFYQRMRRESRGHYTLEYVLICKDARTVPVGQIMQKYYDLLGIDIETQPTNYLWTHKRWK